MEKLYKIILISFIVLIVIVGAFLLMGNSLHVGEGPSYNASALSNNISINMDNWRYDKTKDIYYQIGLVYCMNPEDVTYESCGIYVPGKYFEGTKISNGKYVCKINESANVGNYTAGSAPIVMPIDTPRYSACAAPTSYKANKVKAYTDEGFIYLDAGCRGKDNAEAPDGVVDLKSAITYYRFNGDVLPGNNEKIFAFGHSGGGAQSAILGASGNSELYNPYLEDIGAARVDKNGNRLSDAIEGSMCWCPITNFDTANGAYEWNMGQYVRSSNTFAGALSNDLAEEYAVYINDLGLKDPNGNTLTLKESKEGVYASGSYYDYMLDVTEESLNNFLNDTTFPYTSSSDAMEGMQDANAQSDDGEMPTKRNVSDSSTTYKTAKDYLNSLNGNDTWIEYDSSTNTAKITSLEAFVKHCKNPSRPVPAFDFLNRSQIENELFALDAKGPSHFDKTLGDLLNNNSKKYSKYSDYPKNYAKEYRADLASKDSLNNSMETRMNMYNPMYYLCDYYDGAGSSDVANYWRINTGIEQGDTSLCVEVNLYLAVLNKVSKDNVDFSTVWDQGHIRAERTGSSTSNFINWVNDCLN